MIQDDRHFAVKRLFALAGLFVLSVLAVCVLTLLFSTNLRCPSLLARSMGVEDIPLPRNCSQTPNVTADNILKHLEQERTERGLVFHEWIVCREVPAGGLAFMNDPHWLPSYVPGTYQFRRTVIIVPYPHPPRTISILRRSLPDAMEKVPSADRRTA